MCRYCEIEILSNEAKRNIRKNQRVTMKIVRNMLNENLYYLEVDTNSYQKEEIPISYCPMCRKEVGRVRVADKNATLWEDIKIIFEDKYINLFNDIEPDYENNCMKGLTLNDCLRIAKENGYKRGTIMVLSESYLDGDVYRYGNYQDDEWYEIGKLVGFA